EATSYTPDVEKFMRQHLADSYVVAVGEIGQDYYYNHSPREKQIEVFKQQMDLAAEFGLPVQIHTRDAEEDTIEILKSYQGRVGGVLHCFTGSRNLAMKALDFG